jgi:hypothetical protein
MYDDWPLQWNYNNLNPQNCALNTKKRKDKLDSQHLYFLKLLKQDVSQIAPKGLGSPPYKI